MRNVRLSLYNSSQLIEWELIYGKFQSATENIDRRTKQITKDCSVLSPLFPNTGSPITVQQLKTGSNLGMCAKVASFALCRQREGPYMLADFSYAGSILSIFLSYPDKKRMPYLQWHAWNACLISPDERLPSTKKWKVQG